MNKDKLIKEAIEKRITRSMTNKLMKKHSYQAIATINNLIIPEEEKVTLKSIAFKLFHSIQLSQEESIFWNSFSNCERSYLLTGDSQSPIDFTEYQEAGYHYEQEYQLPQYQPVTPPQAVFPEHEPHLFFDPSTSEETSDSEEPETQRFPFPEHPFLIASDNSFSASLPAPGSSRDSLPAHLPTFTEKPDQELKSIPSTSRGRPPGAKSKVESWKNTVNHEWRPASKTSRLKLESDPDSISSRTRQRREQNEQPQHDAVDLNLDSISADSGNQNQQRRQNTSSGVQENWQLCYRCAFSPHSNSSKFVQGDRNTRKGNQLNQQVCEKRVSTISHILQGGTPCGQTRGTPGSSTYQGF